MVVCRPSTLACFSRGVSQHPIPSLSFSSLLFCLLHLFPSSSTALSLPPSASFRLLSYAADYLPSRFLTLFLGPLLSLSLLVPSPRVFSSRLPGLFFLIFMLHARSILVSPSPAS